ncbi:hypothetical protein C9374_002653 [Naegleria lovaniensis]|uniref:Uncharacterized protein n=1 Tax=Naegleria lovaniensis TaxID=51637 RepID=A0AA88GSH2_NAELO|nr:uncharacterized protein C9374_002653 [Naegleria lovaniensis]KAG2386207.1 hypothetical protein C9374_002653 [Naegleria lovaniensis]
MLKGKAFGRLSLNSPSLSFWNSKYYVTSRMFSKTLFNHSDHERKTSQADPSRKIFNQETNDRQDQTSHQKSKKPQTSSADDVHQENNSNEKIKRASESSLPFLHEVKEELFSNEGQRSKYYLSKFFTQSVGSTEVVQYVMNIRIPKWLAPLAILIVLYFVLTQIKMKTQVGELIKQIKDAKFISNRGQDESENNERLIKVYGKVKCSVEKPLNSETPQLEVMNKSKHSQHRHTPRQDHDILMYHYIIRSVENGSKGFASNTEFYEIVYATSFPIYLKYYLEENIIENERNTFEKKWWSNDNSKDSKPRLLPQYSMILDIMNENQTKKLVSTFSDEGLHKLSPNEIAPFLHTERIISTSNKANVIDFFSELEKIAQKSSMKPVASINLENTLKHGNTYYITEKVLRVDDSVFVMGPLRKELEVLHLNCNIISSHNEKDLIHNLQKQNSFLVRKYYEF